ncbi:FHA domain-containing protein [uncultured Corynebacterium sp.]|uniref:FHA domain-containing protein FhaB/FipA n=1 Tax=uncultured Corynebacterium sp. TaxID=159447 RepID=UPI0025D9FFE5|nr:FHA domain-containing protein [uncultured Corynebacterium sp.]
MQSTLVLVVKIGLLVVLWLFIWVTVRAMNRDVGRAATSGAVPVSGGQVAAYATPSPAQHRGRGFSRSGEPQSLTLTTGPLTGTTLALAGYDEITVGRSSGCTLVLEDDFASGTHARLMRRGADWYLEDLDSRNGTFLAGQRIDQPEPLRAGSEFRIGQTTVRMDA